VEEPQLPKFDYHLDESDTDILVLRRQDGSFVAAFSARGAIREGILEAAEKTTGPCSKSTQALLAFTKARTRREAPSPASATSEEAPSRRLGEWGQEEGPERESSGPLVLLGASRRTPPPS
jgi:hypothetical protein